MDVPPEGDPLGGEWVWWFPSHYRRGCVSSPVFFVKKTVQNPDSFEFFISPLYSLYVKSISNLNQNANYNEGEDKHENFF